MLGDSLVEEGQCEGSPVNMKAPSMIINGIV